MTICIETSKRRTDLRNKGLPGTYFSAGPDEGTLLQGAPDGVEGSSSAGVCWTADTCKTLPQRHFRVDYFHFCRARERRKANWGSQPPIQAQLTTGTVGPALIIKALELDRRP